MCLMFRREVFGEKKKGRKRESCERVYIGHSVNRQIVNC